MARFISVAAFLALQACSAFELGDGGRGAELGRVTARAPWRKARDGAEGEQEEDFVHN